MTICSWVNPNDPLQIAYHKEEWGRPLHDDQKLFELLCLESYQAGLSWSTVLHKRQAFRAAFYNYDPKKVAKMTDHALDQLLEKPELIRHKAKLYATRTNAQAFLKIQDEFGSFNHYLWQWVNWKPIVSTVSNYYQMPNQTKLSQNLAKDLKKRGFTFIGPVMTYSFLQAAGLVNDHEDSCKWK